jgi:hypothetical protein
LLDEDLGLAQGVEDLAVQQPVPSGLKSHIRTGPSSRRIGPCRGSPRLS